MSHISTVSKQQVSSETLPRIETDKNHPVILFDGDCNLCNATVNFIISHDRAQVFRFASLQTDFAKALLTTLASPLPDANSVILIEDGRIFIKSTAIFRILKRLNGLWRVGYFFALIPKFVRDWTYDFVAKHRYRWFGMRKTCRMPEESDKDRFLA